jgi:hypothetical protein
VGNQTITVSDGTLDLDIPITVNPAGGARHAPGGHGGRPVPASVWQQFTALPRSLLDPFFAKWGSNWFSHRSAGEPLCYAY